MNKFIAIAVLAFVVVAHGYNFEDSDFNEYMASQYEFEELDSPAHPRARRDEDAASEKDKCHKRHHHFKFCCADESLKKIHEEDKAMKKECFKSVTGKDKHSYFSSDPFKCDAEKVEKARNEMHCVTQCVGEKKGHIDAAGKPNEEKIKEAIKKCFAGETWLTPTLDALLEKCFEEARKAPGKDGEKCSQQGLTFGHCFWRELQTSCPADQIKDQKACDRVRERIKTNPNMPFPYHKYQQLEDE